MTFFDSLVHHIESDLELAEKYKTASGESSTFTSSLEGLQIHLEVERADVPYKLSTLTLSSSFTKIEIFANHPPGWLFIRISKRSAMFEGVIHYGVIEIVLHAQRDRPYDLNFTRCGWLWFEGMPDKDKIRPRLIAELLWKHLMIPEIPAQLEELSEKARR
ncbi:MAG: hypothetical protein WAM85_07720 [Terracidiphilus sp.]